MSRHAVLITVLAALVAWKLWRTDWIVNCRYYYTDTDPPPTVAYGTEFFHPPPSPFWDPPTPVKLIGRTNAQWSDWEFFQGGGSWGPLEEPHLRVHWLLLTGKILGVGIPALLLIYGIAKVRCESGDNL